MKMRKISGISLNNKLFIFMHVFLYFSTKVYILKLFLKLIELLDFVFLERLDTDNNLLLFQLSEIS